MDYPIILLITIFLAILIGLQTLYNDEGRQQYDLKYSKKQ